MIAPVLAICPCAVDDHNGPIDSKRAIWENPRYQPTPQDKVIVPAGERDVRETKPQIGWRSVNRRGCSVDELFGNVARDPDVAHAQDSGQNQEGRDDPAPLVDARRRLRRGRSQRVFSPAVMALSRKIAAQFTVEPGRPFDRPFRRTGCVSSRCFPA